MRLPALVAIALAASIAASGASSRSSSLRGGTYRVGWEGVFDMGTDGGDPTGEADPRTFGIFSNLLLRTLVGYDHVAGPAGRKLVPDLAESVPTPTDGGRTYTFTLKKGIRFGPPVDREITSRDIRYAIERMARPKNGAQYAYLYRVIEGFDASLFGRAKAISGIDTPTPRRIVFHLNRPVADFLHRLTLPATAPIPPEVGRCFEGKREKYGGDLVSSGPYMYEGADRVRIGSCAEIKPMVGNGYPLTTLVRNPRYDPKTDSPDARENNPDRFVFLVVKGHPSVAAVIKKLDAGDLDDAILSSSPKVLAHFTSPARERGAIRVDPNDWLFYLSFNLTHPPFDDVHVRRALSFAIDRAALRDAWGGAAAGSIAHHLIPDSVLGGRLAGFDPFGSRGDHGDVRKARAEMAKSRYATKHGVCVASACKHVWMSSDCNSDFVCGDIEYAASQRITPLLAAAGARIGIRFRSHAFGGSDVRVPKTYRYIPISVTAYWRGLYPDAASFIDPVFASWDITPAYNPNTSLVGIAPPLANSLQVKGRVRGVPSVDADIARCDALAADARLDCYAALDRKLSTDVVPWVPFLWRNRITVLGPQVTKWEFDASSGTTSFAHVAVKR